MDNQQLQAWVEHVSLTCFGKPFRHKAAFNSRLRSTGGRYFTKTHDIDISRKQFEMYGAEETEKIIKHELCHYHLHLSGRGYKHRDADFIQLLKEVGGTRYCRALPSKKKEEPYRYMLECQSCRTVYYRKRRMDPKKYACGKCRGPLKLSRLNPERPPS